MFFVEYRTHGINHMGRKLYRFCFFGGLGRCKPFQSNHSCVSFPACPPPLKKKKDFFLLKIGKMVVGAKVQSENVAIHIFVK